MSGHDKNTLSGMTVSLAMRKQLNQLPQKTTISSAINTLIKYKINGLLTTDDHGSPIGVLSKTDIMGAYYADLPLNSPLSHIMSSPPLFCKPDDPLENALVQMRENSVYRLYVIDEQDDSVLGSLAYPDIVGLLYQYCCKCEYSYFSRQRKHDEIRRSRVSDIMTKEVKTVTTDDSLSMVMEELSLYRMGAILVVDQAGTHTGVISKTDLILAYKHKAESSKPARAIMSTPVQTCNADDLLEDAIRTMIFSDIHRLFVQNDQTGRLEGVFSLTDAARNKSGSCHACVSSRITVDGART